MNPSHDNGKKRAVSWLLPVLGVLLVVALTIVVEAPAAWIGRLLPGAGRVHLADAQGSIWRGSALLVLSDNRSLSTMPGRLDWRCSGLDGAGLRIDLRHPDVIGSLHLRIGWREILVAAGQAQVQADLLGALGAPFNTLRPAGVLALRWGDVTLGRGRASGELTLRWRDAHSALSPVVPLGEYELRLRLSGAHGQLDLATLTGPLRLLGSGTISAGGLDFSGTASADEPSRPALAGLLAVLGERSGDEVLLRVRM